MSTGYHPSGWTLAAGGVAVVALAAWWATLHPGIWGHHEFEGMVETIFLGLFSLVCAPVVLSFAVVGLIRKDPMALVVIVAVAGIAAYFFTLRDTSVWH